MPNTCPTTPYSNEGDKFNEKENTTQPIQSPHSDKQTPYNAISSPTETIQSPYSRRSNASEKQNPYSKKESIFSDLANKFDDILSPYNENHFCPLPWLLIDSIHALYIDSSEHKLYINGRL
jgi:hypothetical protein